MSKFLTESNDPVIKSGTPVNAVQAELTVDPAGTNNAIKFTARAYGRRGNRVSVEYRHDVGPVAAHLIKAGANNTLRFDARTPGDAGDAITVALLDPAAPNASLGVREYAGNVNVDLATGPGDKAAASLAAGAGSVEVEVDAPGPGGNVYTATVERQVGEDAALSVALVGTVLTVMLGNDKGDAAAAEIGTAPYGAVQLQAGTPGAAGNAHSVVVEGGTEDGALTVALLDAYSRLTVILGMDKGDQAQADIGGGSVNIKVGDPGSAGNDYQVQVIQGSGVSVPLSAVLYANMLTVELPTDVYGDPVPAPADDVVAAINAAAYSTLTAARVPYVGSDPLTAPEGPTAFTGGGANIQPDPAKNTPTLVAAAINSAAYPEIQATAIGTVSLSAPEGPEQFTGGGANIQPDPAKNTASLVAAAINASEGATFTATAVYDDPADEQYAVPFTGGGENAPVVSSGDEVVAAVDLFSALVTCDVVAGNGALAVTPFAAENLHGGSDFGEGEALEVETVGNKIIVHLATDPYEGEIVTTAQDIIDAVGAYHALVTVAATEVYSDGVVAATTETRLAGGTPSGPVSAAGTILEDAQFRYVAFEDALLRDDPDFESHWDRIAL